MRPSFVEDGLNYIAESYTAPSSKVQGIKVLRAWLVAKVEIGGQLLLMPLTSITHLPAKEQDQE